MRPLGTTISISRPAPHRAGRPGRSHFSTISLALLAFLAIAGSLFYGASLSLVLPGWQTMGSGAWLAISAGLGWCIFLPALLFATRQPLVICCHACLVTMAYGEAILLAGAVGNVLLAHVQIVNSVAFNFVCVAISNVTMAAVMVRQMARLGVPRWKTLALWIIALNGSGGVFFYFLRFLVEVRL